MEGTCAVFLGAAVVCYGVADPRLTQTADGVCTVRACVCLLGRRAFANALLLYNIAVAGALESQKKKKGVRFPSVVRVIIATPSLPPVLTLAL